MDQIISNFVHVLGFIGIPIALGLFLYYGISQSWGRRKPPVIQEIQDEGTERVYADDNRDLKQEAAKTSSKL